MTTVIPFLPSNLNVPTFIATFDGEDYKVTITWNISAQRYYVNIYGLDGSWIVTVPLIATPPARALASAVYNSFQKIVIVTMVSPDLWPIPLSPKGLNTPPGTMVDYTLESFSPVAYNGLFRCLHINDLTFSFPMATDLGPVAVIGSVSRILNMVAGVFKTTTFVYRNGAFEVNP